MIVYVQHSTYFHANISELTTHKGLSSLKVTKMGRIIRSFIFITLVGLCSAQQQDCFGEGVSASPDIKQVIKLTDTFGINIFKDIASSYPGNSIVISPYSVWNALNLAYFGSAGTTQTQLEAALGLTSKGDAYYGGKVIETRLSLDRGTTFNKADKAYFDTDLTLRQCALSKLTEVVRVNFKEPSEAAAKINDDVSLATKGKIKRFLSAGVIANAQFVLISAVYFKGLWSFPFLASATAVKPFYDEQRRREISNATMMTTQAKLRSAVSSTLDATVLELPYADSSISMFFILPNEKSSTVQSVLSRLSSDVLDQVTRDFKNTTTIVTIPKFKMTTRIANELKSALLKVGIKDLFDPAAANFSDFLPSGKAFVEDALHQATIEVTEEGTVATAVTGLVGTRSGVPDIVTFVADRPFIFLIRDVSQGLTLFIGVLRNPNQTIPF